MRRLVFLARIYVAVLGISFLFGQFFFSSFSLLASVIGLTAMIGAGCSSAAAARSVRYFAAVVCAVAMIGIASQITEYYVGPRTPGDQYAWELVAPLLAALSLLVGVNIVWPAQSREAVSTSRRRNAR